MNEQNLQSRPPWTREEALRQAQKGGSVKSWKKTRAAKTRELLKSLKNSKGDPIKDEQKKRLYDIIMDPEVAGADALILIKKIQGMCETPKDLTFATRLQLEWQRINHGTKEVTNNVSIQNNTQVNVDLSDAIVNSYLKRKAEKALKETEITIISDGTSSEDSTVKNIE